MSQKSEVAMMNKMNLAYCNNCEDLVEFHVENEFIEESFKGEKIAYNFKVGRCNCCNAEVATDIDYNTRRSNAKNEAYKRSIGIIDLEGISEILDKYDVGKEALAEVAGFGKVTIKRYYEGFIPSREYSDVLIKMRDSEEFFIERFDNNKDKLREVARNKILTRYARLLAIGSSKTEQVANYIVTNLGEVTPLALEKLLYFSNGVNYAINGKPLILEECQAWAHGPVYPYIYNLYKKYKYNPIDNGISSKHGCMLSKVSGSEIEAIDLVISTFGLYSPKTLEMISHSQWPWQEKRVGLDPEDTGNNVIDQESVKTFFIENKLNNKTNIMRYIDECVSA